MKRFFTGAAGKICIAVLALLLLGGGGTFGGYLFWLYQQPKFHDVTIELGTPLPPVEDFLTEYADPEKVAMVTGSDTLAMDSVGQQAIVFSHDSKEETVYLTIVDTTAPVAEFKDLMVSIDAVLSPEDFVVSVTDLSATELSFVKPLEKPETYGETTVQVAVTDASGNRTVGECSLRYIWMYDAVTLELGEALEKGHLLLDPEKDGELIDQAVLDEINASPVGIYTVSSTSMEQTCQCVVTVQDTTAPVLELREVKIDVGEMASLESFVKTATDISGEVKTRLVTQLDCAKIGTQTVVVEAEDINGNITSAETVLRVFLDSKPPVFSGVKEMTVEKHSKPDFAAGVTAKDTRDGVVEFTFDASKVDTGKAGTYYVTYTAKDAVGNKATARRKVTVNHDAEDTRALVNSIAATLSSDPEKIRDYVRTKIAYSSSWGGSDPVWHGFTMKSGNCYVHALCLQRLLQAKGHTTKLIWVTDKTHYWVQINLGGKWRHIDATPGPSHSKYSLMTDEQRASTLKGRDWDRTKWPACE